MEIFHRMSGGVSISRRRDSARLSLVGPGLVVLPVIDTVWSGSPFQPPLLASTAHFSETSLRSCSQRTVSFLHGLIQSFNKQLAAPPVGRRHGSSVQVQRARGANHVVWAAGRPTHHLS